MLEQNEIQFPHLGIDLHVDSTAFQIFGIDIQWYGLLITCGLLLAMYEDVNVFPVLMRGYNAYKDTTPFLFPTKESIRRCFNGKKAK